MTTTDHKSPFADLQKQLPELIERLQQMLKDAVGRTGEFVHSHTSDIERFLDKAEGTFDERTQGKYADQAAKVRTQVSAGVHKIAEQRPSARTDWTDSADDPR